MNKYAAVLAQAQKADRIILDSIEHLTDLRRGMQQMLENGPEPEHAEAIDEDFRRLALSLEGLGNAISVFAKIVVSEDGEIDEIDGMEDEHGVRLQ